MLGLTIAAIAATLLDQPRNIDLKIDLSRTRDEINPYIYGQFIEHLGRCIYGGIWAEMLEDRKFFFPITKNFAPFVSMQNTDFPGIGASPWQILSGDVAMTKEDVFVGRHTPILHSGTAIRQGHLGVVSGKEYTGYIWLKGVGGQGKVTVRFDNQSQTFDAPLGAYSKHPFRFKASETTDDARLEIEVTGHDVAVGTVSIMPADNVRGMRRDTLAKLKELGGTIYRWPGGNFVSGYDWRDGIGDRDRRPPRTNPAWGGLEHNDFGTDEFIDFCREIGTDPLVTVNTGFGDAYTAAQWVEYCNGSTKTIGGSWRAKNGHRKAYDVKTWCVGNEMWGEWQLGFMKLDQYVAKHNWIAEAMLKVDPNLTLIGSGDLGDPDSKEPGKSWSKGLLQHSADHMDMVSEHFYSGRLPWTKSERFPLDQAVRQMSDSVKQKAEGHRKLQKGMKSLNGKIVPIAMDEWNYWHRNYEFGELGCEYDLADGLGIAAGLHEFFRQTDIIKIATYAQTVNVIGAIKTNRTAAEIESTGLVLEVYRKRFGSIPVAHSGKLDKIDVEVALTKDRKLLTIGFMNPTDEAIQLSPTGFKTEGAKAYIVTGATEFSKNSPGKPRQVDIVELKGTTVPRISCGVIVIPIS